MKKLLALLLLLSFSAHAGVGQWSSTDTSNNGAAPTGWPTGMSPADVKLTGRRMMSFVHDAYLDSQWVSEEVSPTWINTTTFTISTSDPTFYHANRRIKTQSAAGYVYSSISASTAIGATGASVTVVNDTGTISNTLFKVWFGSASAISPSITSTTLGLQNLANPSNIVSGTNSIKTFTAVNSISMTVNGVTQAYLNTSGLTVSGTGVYTALTSPLISTTTNAGTVSATFGNFGAISATSVSATNGPWKIIQSVLISSTTSIQLAQSMVYGNIAPSITSGSQVLSGTFTPIYSNSFVRATVITPLSWGGGGGCVMALYKNSASAVATSVANANTTGTHYIIAGLTYQEAPASVSAATWSVRAGGPSGTDCYVNRGQGGFTFGGTFVSSLLLEEIQP